MLTNKDQDKLPMQFKFKRICANSQHRTFSNEF